MGDAPSISAAAVRAAPRPRAWPPDRTPAAGTVRIEAAKRALDRLVTEPEVPSGTALAAFTPAQGRRGLDGLVRGRGTLRPAPRKPHDVVRRWAMGEVMPSMIGRADPAAVRARLEAALAPVMEDANRG